MPASASLAVSAANIGTWDFNPVSGELSWSDRCKAIFGLRRHADVSYPRFLRSLHPETLSSALRETGGGEVPRDGKLLPTIVDLLGMPVEPSREAQSLMPLVTDPGAAGRREALSSVPRKAGRVARSVRTARFRYTEWDAGKGGVELYDHQSDPGELRNLADDAQHKTTREELHALLRPRIDEGAKAATLPAPPKARESE